MNKIGTGFILRQHRLNNQNSRITSGKPTQDFKHKEA